MEQQSFINGKVINILFADDDADDREFLLTALNESRIPHTFNSVEDGSRLLDYLHKKNEFEEAIEPDVIILDINMPVVDGFTALKKIKSDDKLRHIPVYILSTSKSQDDMDKAKKLGAEAFFIKNNKLRDWTETVQDIMYDYLMVPQSR
jgi:two-component system, response regulator